MKVSPGLWLIRHLIAFVLLYFAYRSLVQWYLYQKPADFFPFIFFASAALIFACWKLIRILTIRELAGCTLLLAFLLPWNEWVSGPGDSSAENHSYELLFQLLFLYGMLALFYLFPRLRDFLADKLRKILHFGQFPDSPRVFALCFLLSSVFLAIFYFRMTPIVKESALHIFQAHIFNKLKTVALVPPSAEFFIVDGLIQKDGTWFANQAPGLAALLSMALPLRLEWFVVPVLGALSLYIWIRYIATWYSHGTATLFAILSLLSPFLLITSSTIMSAVAELALASLTIFLCRAMDDDAFRNQHRNIRKPAHRWIKTLLLFCVVLLLFPTGGLRLVLFVSPALVFISFKQPKYTLIPMVSAIVLSVVITPISVQKFQWTWNFAYLNDQVLWLNHWLTGWHVGFFSLLVPAMIVLKLDRWDRILIASCIMLFLFSAFGLGSSEANTIESRNSTFGPHALYLVSPIFLFWIARFTPTRTSVMAIVLLSILLAVPQRIPERLLQCQSRRLESAVLQQEINQLPGKKLVVFLDHRVSPEYVTWNDPFLESRAIYSRDLGAANASLQTIFTDHQVTYFRPNMAGLFGRGVAKPIGLFAQRDAHESGYISFFELALKLGDDSNIARDLFDIGYTSLFNGVHAAEQVAYLEKQLGVSSSSEKEYRQAYRRAVVYTGLMMSRPKAIFEMNGNLNQMDTHTFLSDYSQARSNFHLAGGIGEKMEQQFDKLERRIDQDDDKKFSESEIRLFLMKKLRKSDL